MRKRDNSPNDEEQEAAVPTDCPALLAMTRPLIIVENTPLSSREEEIRESTLRPSAQQEDPRSEFTLKRGEILRRAKPKLSTEGDKALTAGQEVDATKPGPGAEDGAAGFSADLPETDSDLQFRIYLGMS